MTRFFFILFFALLFVSQVAMAACVSGSSAQATGRHGPSVSEFKLANGLKIFVKVDRRAPVVVSQIWYKVGSAYEPKGLTGISHVLEHMMFRGTKQFPEGKIDQLIRLHGGSQNAMTSRDFTMYFQTLPARYLALSFQLEADRMHDLDLKLQYLKPEMKVVKSEKRMRIDNNPKAIAMQHFQTQLYPSGPYHHPVIGWLSDLNHMTIQDLKAWYQNWYGPNNAFIVVVGDVQPEHIKQLAEKYFGSLKARPVPSVNLSPLPLNKLQSLQTIKANAKVPFVVMGYRVPSYKSSHHKWQVYALTLLSQVLGASDSAYLQTNLVRKNRVAAFAESAYSPFQLYGGEFILYAVPAPGHTDAELQKQLLASVHHMASTLVSNKVLSRAKVGLLADNVYSRDSLFRQAMQIGRLESIGLSWKLQQVFLNEMQKITPEQVRQVAAEFLTSNRLRALSLQPGEHKNATS